MKKFVFTLQSVYSYKQTVEKTQKAELSEAEAALAELYRQEQLMEQAYERSMRAQEETLKRHGYDLAAELAQHGEFFRFLRDMKKELDKRIAEAMEYRDRCRERLIITMKELKTYAKLYDEQYTEYQQEVKREEEKDMGDLVSFNSIS